MGKDGKGESPLHLVEKGNFTQARCECGWNGPGQTLPQEGPRRRRRPPRGPLQGLPEEVRVSPRS